MDEPIISKVDLGAIALGAVLITAQALELYVMFGPVSIIREREQGSLLNQPHRLG